MRAITSLAILLLVCLSVQAQDFEEFKRQQEEAMRKQRSEQDAAIKASVAEYEAYRAKELAAFQQFKNEMERLWGEFKQRTKEEWVEYRETGKIRASVNFETGKGRVEIVASSPQEVQQAMASMQREVERTFTDKGKEREFEVPGEKNKDISDKPVLAGQLPVANTTQAASNVVSKIETKPVVGSDGVARTIVYVNFDLAPNHLQTRARSVEKYVYDFSKANKLDPALVFAIIHTESYFNPAARSQANAMGLMQLVPTSGGKDAYQKVYGKTGVPTAEYLFVSENNVKLGTAYLDILLNNYFKGVQNQEVKEYLIICAYNTGAGNVARAYTGNTNLRAALPIINQKKPQETYDFLLKNLPYDETKGYLKKVTERRKMYQNWAKS